MDGGPPYGPGAFVAQPGVFAGVGRGAGPALAGAGELVDAHGGARLGVVIFLSTLAVPNREFKKPAMLLRSGLEGVLFMLAFLTIAGALLPCGQGAAD